QLLREQIIYQFSYMTESDKLTFVAHLRNSILLLSSFAVTAGKYESSVAGRVYDRVLLEKGVVAQSTTALTAKVVASGDQETLQVLQKITMKKEELRKLAGAPLKDLSAWRGAVERLQQQLAELQAELVRRVPQAGDAALAVTWHQVQSRLAPTD